MKIITLGTTKEKIKAGVDKVADVVKVTLGGKGKNVIINNGFQNVQIINDGISIAREIELDDEIENTGAILAKGAAEKTNEQAGDATTTTIVLLQAFLNEMMKIQSKDVRGLRDEIKIELEKVIAELDKRKVELKEEDILRIAKNSALDDEIAQVIFDTIKEIGKDGVVSVEDSNEVGIKSEVVAGIKIDDGYVTPYMITDVETLKAEMKNPKVLLTKKRIGSINDIMPLLSELKRMQIFQLVIMAQDISDEVLNFFVANKLQGIFTGIVVKTRNMDDIEVVTGAQIVSEENQLKYTMDVLGEAEKITATQYNTIVIGGKAAQEDVDAKIGQLKKQLEVVESQYEKETIAQRIAKLTGGVSVIKIGGENEQVTKEKKLKMEDALNSVRAAMDEGIIEGGGIALYKISNTVYFTKSEAKKLIFNVLRKPFAQILENSDEDFKTVSDGFKGGCGYNVVTRQWENFYETGIIDPVKAVKCALRNAFATGNQIMTAEASVIVKNEKTN
jgi:chaperonin GroEL